MSTLTTVRPPVNPGHRNRKPLPPVGVNGYFSGGGSIAELCEGSAVLVIRKGDASDADEMPYWTVADFGPDGRIAYFQLQRFGTGDRYNLPADLADCDCPDCTYRNRECKHMAALRQALTALTGRNAVPACA